MSKFTVLAALTLMAAGSAAVLTNTATVANAAAPGCKPSVGSGNKWSCTTDFTAKSKSDARRTVPTRRLYGHSASRKFKIKTIPCYQNPVPGCR